LSHLRYGVIIVPPISKMFLLCRLLYQYRYRYTYCTVFCVICMFSSARRQRRSSSCDIGMPKIADLVVNCVRYQCWYSSRNIGIPKIAFVPLRDANANSDSFTVSTDTVVHIMMYAHNVLFCVLVPPRDANADSLYLLVTLP